MSTPKIKLISGPEPLRNAEYPFVVAVGRMFGADELTVSTITHRLVDRGDHVIGWFDVWAADDRLLASFNERHVEQVQYDED